ncbi:Dna2/Cas4 domain-containing protein [Tautonia sociabilis]|uniref:Dna2/Cas4 domain-containing protein n=1 Tax=Tautonia sociabilis TaxID=2080755 RepID=A0A432MPV9_9BACT|nr:Dna2/Cas4 domain-containing protein [Tautonia sociabilis]RUL89462.1 Dna2/Cas4 domain-containing protein [Tautonia sociabilis]
MIPDQSLPLWPIALCVLLAGVLLVIAAWRMREARGLASGQTLALDDVSLYSTRYRLAGRPDRIVRIGKTVVPEEWKSAKRLWPGHIAQMGAYFLLIEERYGVRPPYGYVVLGTGERHRIENEAKLRAWVLDLAGQIREARMQLHRPLPVRPKPNLCRSCGQRGNCSLRIG